MLYAINLLHSPSDISVDDFNKNNLLKYTELYADNPPEILIEYFISHRISEDDTNDESIIRLLPFLGIKEFEENRTEKDGKAEYNIAAKIKAVYSLDIKYLDNYKREFKNANDFDSFKDINDSSVTYEVIQKFNNEILNDEYIELRKLFKEGTTEISVFDEHEKEDLAKNVSSLRWDTSYKLFTEVFSENSKYMTAHQAKGLEWDKVIVSLTPTRRDGTNISDVFSNPQLIAENSSNEFVRMYYVACSRAREDLYIHIPSGCDKDTIERSLHSYIEKANCKLEYEFC